MQTPLRALIVDTEAPDRELLQDMLATHRNVRVVGEANSAPTALSLYETLHPNLLFMDVQMPKGDGFSLLPKLKPLPSVIFVTASDDFAVKAFEVDAVDYLLKPVRPERLANALQRVVHSQKPSQAERLSYDDRILLDSDDQMRLVFVTEISGIAAEGNYTRIQLADGSSSFVRRGITQWDFMLPKPFFVRVERSLIIHLQAVRKVIAQDRDEVSVEVEGFRELLALGRRGSFRLRRALRERERSTTVAERAVEERITGWSVERVVKPSDEISYRAPVYILSQHTSEENHTTGRKTVLSTESHVSAEPQQVLLHGQLIRGASRIESKLTRFEPPVAMLKLPIPAPGEPFPSVMRSHGMTVDLRPYERAEETLKTPVAEFRCLRISSRGTVTGELPGVPTVRIAEGSVEATSWYAREVGLVKQVPGAYHDFRIAEWREDQFTGEED